ncbi:MAG: ATP-dependent DNA helicase RecG [Deltaproteobacteria bacterium]|nr:ATP-dependent DNA helicase RecG [Deltaproteobacteria bacterium]
MDIPLSPFPLSELARSLTTLPGVGPSFAAGLAARGLRTWGDALLFLPSRYEDRREVTPIARLTEGRNAVVKGVVQKSGRLGKGGKVLFLEVADATGKLTCLWFRFKKTQLEANPPGQELFLAGTPTAAPRGGLQMAHPEVYPAETVGPDHPHLGRVLPRYPEVEGVPAGSLRRILGELLRRALPGVADPLFGQLPRELYPLAAGEALTQAHQPTAEAPARDLDPRTAAWRQSLAVNELFYYELGLSLLRRRDRERTAPVIRPAGRLLARFLEGLPFRLTPGQDAALQEIRRDLANTRPMYRLLAGDVGTGKTVVAAAAAALAAEAGVQTAFMAPTEVLARQHQAGLAKYLAPLGVGVVLAAGGQPAPERRQAQAAAARGGAAGAVVLGTQALLSQSLDFQHLGLVIIDEQHRFGVEDRLALTGKGARPHLLVLSATPIPRTLHLALGGHLDLSDLPQRPGGGPRVATRVLAFDQRAQAVEALKEALGRGEQAYVICPLVEASDRVEAQDAVATHQRLAAYFPEAPVGLLHGRMSGAAQEEVLDNFRAGRCRILVATTVVEVGVDVPGATLMIVLGAERFGLSQLHQLRGRVGRGERPGLCLLVAGPEPGELAGRRLATLAATTDGLAVAEADLALRGPGLALGTRQAGLPDFRVADWLGDAELLPPLREFLAHLLAHDPDLTDPAHAPLREETLRRWGRTLNLAAAG